MVCRLERALLHRVKLNPLNLDLQNRGQPSDRSELFGFGILDTDFLSIKGTVDGSVDIPRATGDIDFDIAPSFVLGSCSFFGRDIGPSLTIEQTERGMLVQA